jgi:pimeloyl-ACP methyl ester carboxylesterase
MIRLRLSALSSFSALAVSLFAAAPALAGFYDVTQAELAGEPGTLIRSEPMRGLAVGKVYRVLYRSTGLSGEPIAVSGMVIVPGGEAPAAGRDIVAWAHPTTGAVQPCAPSLEGKPLLTIQGLRALLERGFVVTATDYPGLGTVGPHPYLVGESEGRAVLDSVRAARALGEAEASNRFAVWGHSQGGQAALFAGDLAKSYAPDLELVGVAAAAPAVELASLVTDDVSRTSGKILVSLAVWSWWKVFDAPFDAMVELDAQADVEKVAQRCLEGEAEGLADVDIEDRLKGPFLSTDPDKTEPWKSIMARNSPGTPKHSAPLFIARGSDDEIIVPDVSADFVERLCRSGAVVRVETIDKADHSQMGAAAAGVAVGWISDRFAGVPAPNSCPPS